MNDKDLIHAVEKLILDNKEEGRLYLVLILDPEKDRSTFCGNIDPNEIVEIGEDIRKELEENPENN